MLEKVFYTYFCPIFSEKLNFGNVKMWFYCIVTNCYNFQIVIFVLFNLNKSSIK